MTRKPKATYFLDQTHLHGRQVTGLERISIELSASLKRRGLILTPVVSRSIPEMILQQWLGIPIRLIANKNAVVMCPGFPPALSTSLFFASKTIAYIHDLFLITRPDDLNRRAKLYMAPSFRFAVSRLKYFFVNSETTRLLLKHYTKPDAKIELLRPLIGDVLGLSAQRNQETAPDATLRILSIGTVEPRKNYVGAANIAEALGSITGRPVELHIVGRVGWGEEINFLKSREKVKLHGYLDKKDVKELVDSCDLFLITSYDEGLGLTALEIQYSCLPVFAPDLPVFRESLGSSATFINVCDPGRAALSIKATLAAGTSETWAKLNTDNLARWNQLALTDLENFKLAIERLAAARV